MGLLDIEPAPIHDIRGRVILEGLIGTSAAGFSKSNEAPNYMGVFVVPMDTLLGLRQPKEIYNAQGPNRTYYELRKFAELAVACDPEVLELFWSYHTRNDSFGSELVRKRSVFLSSKAVESYSDYVTKHAERLKSHAGLPDWRAQARLLWKRIVQGSQLIGTGEMQTRMRGGDLEAIENAGSMLPDQLYDAALAEIERIKRTPVVLPNEPDMTVINDALSSIRRTIDRETPSQPNYLEDSSDRRRGW